MIGFCPLASGSKGNCIYLGTPNTKILIDAGLSARAIKKKLEMIDVDISEIDAVLISHEHSDHINGLRVLSYKNNIPIISNSETAKGICQAFSGDARYKIFTTGEPFEFMDLEIHPFSIQHDTPDPVAFTIQVGPYKLGFCTDLGFAPTLVEKQLKFCDYLYLEANHQPSMVQACARPAVYKQRVLGRDGHLSNENCGKLLSKVMDAKLKKVYLAHLSQECNHEKVALSVVRNEIQNDALDIEIAYQDRISTPTLLSNL